MREAPRHDGPHLRRYFSYFQASDKPQQVVRVRTDVTHYQGRSAAQWVFFPCAPTRARPGAATLYVFHLHQADLPQLAVQNHGFGLAHHGVAGVVVGQAKHQAGLLHAPVQSLCLGQGIGHGFVADHVKTSVQCGHGVVEMAVVGGHDGNHVCTMRVGGFCADEFSPACVTALRR